MKTLLKRMLALLALTGLFSSCTANSQDAPQDAALVQAAQQMRDAFRQGDKGQYIKDIEYNANTKSLIIEVTPAFVSSPNRREMEKNLREAWRLQSKRRDVPVKIKEPPR